jgi:hypothetical protein
MCIYLYKSNIYIIFYLSDPISRKLGIGDLDSRFLQGGPELDQFLPVKSAWKNRDFGFQIVG